MKRTTSQSLRWTSDPSEPPAHFDSGTSQPNKPAPCLFMGVDMVQPPTITWYMWLNLQMCVSSFSSFSSSTPSRGCQEKHFTSAATIHLWPPWGMESGVLARSVLLPTVRPWHTLMKVKQESCIYTLETETRLPDRLLIKLRLPWRRVKFNIEPKFQHIAGTTERQNQLGAEGKSPARLLEVWGDASIIHVTKVG